MRVTRRSRRVFLSLHTAAAPPPTRRTARQEHPAIVQTRTASNSSIPRPDTARTTTPPTSAGTGHRAPHHRSGHPPEHGSYSAPRCSRGMATNASAAGRDASSPPAKSTTYNQSQEAAPTTCRIWSAYARHATQRRRLKTTSGTQMKINDSRRSPRHASVTGATTPSGGVGCRKVSADFSGWSADRSKK